MHQLGSIALCSSQTKILIVHATNTLLKLEGIYSINAEDVMNLFLRVGNKINPCIRETQENSMEIPLQSSLPYILLPMVRASYCAPYPK